jgi:hypothetical protein
MNLQTERKLKMNVREKVLNVIKCCFFNDGHNLIATIPTIYNNLIEEIGKENMNLNIKSKSLLSMCVYPFLVSDLF